MGEIGKYPVAFYYYSSFIKYWLEIIHIPDHIYLKVCYSMLKALDERCRITWASHIVCFFLKDVVLVLCGLAKMLVM